MPVAQKQTQNPVEAYVSSYSYFAKGEPEKGIEAIERAIRYGIHPRKNVEEELEVIKRYKGVMKDAVKLAATEFSKGKFDEDELARVLQREGKINILDNARVIARYLTSNPHAVCAVFGMQMPEKEEKWKGRAELFPYGERAIVEKIPADTGKKTLFPMNGKAEFAEKILPDGRRILLIKGEHFSDEACRITKEKIEPKIKEPEKWVFLIEGKNSSSAIPEIDLLVKIAERSGIPVEDPIISPYHMECIDEVVKKTGVKKEIVLISLTSIMMASTAKANTTEDKVIGGLADLWGYSKEYLRALLDNRFSITGCRNDEELGEMKKEIWSQIDKTSNELSKKRLEQLLEKYKDKEYIAAYVGLNHAVIFD